MRTIVMVALIALVPYTAALAQTATTKPATTKPATAKPAIQRQPATSPKAQPGKGAKACEEYGAGFKAIEGTGSCVKIGGYLRMQGSAR